MASTTYATAGNTALEGRTATHLTLVYNANDASNQRTKAHAAQHEHESIDFKKAFVSAIAIIVIALTCSAAVSLFKSSGVARALDGAETEEIRVVSGDTIWSIADQCVGSAVPTSDAVEWICSHNGLSGRLLEPGQRLVVPMLQ